MGLQAVRVRVRVWLGKNERDTALEGEGEVESQRVLEE